MQTNQSSDLCQLAARDKISADRRSTQSPSDPAPRHWNSDSPTTATAGLHTITARFGICWPCHGCPTGEPAVKPHRACLISSPRMAVIGSARGCDQTLKPLPTLSTLNRSSVFCALKGQHYPVYHQIYLLVRDMERKAFEIQTVMCGSEAILGEDAELTNRLHKANYL